MFMNILVVVVLLGVAYLWCLKGFFSALLHLGCTIAAGAIAFGVWEPLVFLTTKHITQEWLNNLMWAASLIVPFSLSLAILTILVNVLVRANAQCDRALDYVGGGICGLLIGGITAGMCALSMSYTRTHADFMGFQPVIQEKDGYLVKVSGLWVPVDKAVAGLYGMLSTTTLTTAQPLARWYPDFAERGHVMRAGPDETLIKMAAMPDDVGLVGRYTVGQDVKVKLDELLSDTFSTVRQKVKTMNGDPLEGDTRLRAT